MAIINFYTKKDTGQYYDLDVIDHNGTAVDWILKNIRKGVNFSVYEGSLSKENEISRDFKRVKKAKNVSVFLLPSSGLEVAYVLAAVFVVAALTPKPAALPNLNRNQQSPNNSLSERDNIPRPLERIVDLCGTDKMIPDVLSREYSRFVGDVEQRIGYYIVCRNNVMIEDIKEGDTLISDVKGGSAGVYGAFKSPNNSTPDIQIGDPINEPVYSVTQSADVIGQTLLANNVNTVKMDGNFSATQLGEIVDNGDNVDFTENYSVGDNVNIVDVYVDIIEEGEPVRYKIGDLTHIVTAVEKSKISFDISADDSWSVLSISGDITLNSLNPKIEEIQDALIGPFKMTSFKVNKLLVNVNALNGVYKENSNGRALTSVSYDILYQKLDDSGNTIGSEIIVSSTITGRTSSEKGQTNEIDLGGDTFVQWSIRRTTQLDFDFNGTIVDLSLIHI